MLLFRWNTEGVNTMWFWKKKKDRLTTEYDALKESKKRMDAFEEKYNIRSIDLYNQTCDMTIFNDSDRYLWEAYIRTFVRCGGKLEATVPANDFECSMLKEEMIIAKQNDDIKKETAKTPFLFF